ncbi:MAG: AAA family ATPase [Hyphomicrobiaceae bacterium]
MTTTKVPNITNSATPPPSSNATEPAQPQAQRPVHATTGAYRWMYAQYIRRPGDPTLTNLVEFENLSLAVRQHLAEQMGEKTKNKAARAFWAHGRPGEGKTVGILHAVTNAGWNLAIVPSAHLAGKEEGAPIEFLNAILAELVLMSSVTHTNYAILLDDLDLGIANASDDMGKTVNSDLLVNHIMALCDNRHLYRNTSGANIPIFVTANNASGMRESLLRDGRATHYTHKPTQEDRANIAWALLQPKTTAERELVAEVVHKNKHKSVAFWTALVHRIRALHRRPIIGHGMPDKATIDVTYQDRMPLDPDIVWQAVRDLRVNHVRNYLNKARRFFRA